jgi:hypothetical protein
MKVAARRYDVKYLNDLELLILQPDLAAWLGRFGLGQDCSRMVDADNYVAYFILSHA